MQISRLTTREGLQLVVEVAVDHASWGDVTGNLIGLFVSRDSLTPSLSTEENIARRKFFFLPEIALFRTRERQRLLFILLAIYDEEKKKKIPYEANNNIDNNNNNNKLKKKVHVG